MTLEILLEPRADASQAVVLATVACGDAYYEQWRRYSLPSWDRFAHRFGYGIAVLRETLLPADVSVGWNKFLLPEALGAEHGHDGATVVLDADQVFSPIAPPLRLSDDEFGLVHIEEWTDRTTSANKIMSFLRRRFVDASFPLDSILLMTPEDWRSGRLLDLGGSLPISSGFIVTPHSRAGDLAALTDFALDPEAAWDGGGGDQQFASRELQKAPHHFLDRRWQGIWPSIMAEQHPLLYSEAPVSREVAAEAIVSALVSHWCIHFATSWPEKEYWQVDWTARWEAFLDESETLALQDYLASEVPARSYSRIVAPDIRLVEEP